MAPCGGPANMLAKRYDESLYEGLNLLGLVAEAGGANRNDDFVQALRPPSLAMPCITSATYRHLRAACMSAGQRGQNAARHEDDVPLLGFVQH